MLIVKMRARGALHVLRLNRAQPLQKAPDDQLVMIRKEVSTFTCHMPTPTSQAVKSAHKIYKLSTLGLIKNI
jgi:hypothetical protein